MNKIDIKNKYLTNQDIKSLHTNIPVSKCIKFLTKSF